MRQGKWTFPPSVSVSLIKVDEEWCEWKNSPEAKMVWKACADVIMRQCSISYKLKHRLTSVPDYLCKDIYIANIWGECLLLEQRNNILSGARGSVLISPL